MNVNMNMNMNIMNTDEAKSDTHQC
jgi:hypothetical protein